MRQSVRAIIVKDQQLLVMHRLKFGKEYYTLIGGGIDRGESAEQALLREIDEETGVVVQNPRLVYIDHPDKDYGSQYVYLCQFVSGEPHLRPDSIETKLNQAGQNLNQPMWLAISDLANVPFRSGVLAEHLQHDLVQGFKDQVVEFKSIVA